MCACLWHVEYVGSRRGVCFQVETSRNLEHYSLQARRVPISLRVFDLRVVSVQYSKQG